MTSLACGVCATAAVPGARFCYACGAPLERPAELGEASAERRLVTVLFGDLSEFTAWAEDLDPERVGVVTDRVLAALTDAVASVGGHVDKLTGDGIMAVFGAPTAHEDDPERAVRAAARMQSAVRRLLEAEIGGGRRLGLRVGINTGVVLAGVQAQLSYTVVGDTVNTAARLADAAGVGAVLAGRATALATDRVASWRELEPLRLKGKREQVPAYELAALRPPGARRLGIGDEAPFLGRAGELDRLVVRLRQAARAGEPRTVLVTGDAGVGKTRLASELARTVGGMPGGRALWGRCPPYGEGRDLAPLAEWIRVACGLDGGEPADETTAAVRRTLARLEAPARGAVPAEVVDRLLALLGVPAEREPGPRSAAAPGAGPSRTPLLETVATLLGWLTADGPLLLVVDDLQWAGPQLHAALTYVAERLSGGALLVCLGRGELLAGAGGEPSWWRALPVPELLALDPLDGAATEQLLRSYLGGAALAAPVRDVLLSRAQGNPFFLAELVHLLVERGLLQEADGGWRLVGELPAQMLPAGVQSVLSARIDGLDPVARSVLRAAAIVGTRFTAAAVGAVDGWDEGEVEEALAALVGRGLVVATGSDDEPQRLYGFAHTLARDVAYAGVAKAERARRHASVADWAATELGGGGAELDAFVAGHAERAVALATEMRLAPDDHAYAARPAGSRALGRLGAAALARDDNPHAEQLLTRALELGGPELDPVDRAQLEVARAAARLAQHDLDGAGRDLAGALGCPDDGVRARALVVTGDVRRRQGDDAGARQAFVSALAAASDAGVEAVTAEALRQIGIIDYVGGRFSDAEHRFHDALELAERVGDGRGVGWALQHLTWSATTRGDYPRAEQMLARAAEVFARLDDPGGRSWCAGTEAFVRLLQGRYRKARALARGLLPVARAMGERWGVAACLTIDAFAAAELGDLTVAQDEAVEAAATFGETGDSWGMAMTGIARAAAERGAGLLDAAVDRLEQAAASSRQAHHPTTECLALVLLGYCRLDADRPEAAVVAAERALDVLGGLDIADPGLVGPRVLHAQALRRLGRLDEALAVLDEVTRTREEPSLMFPRRQAVAHYAGALLEAGRPAEALALAQRALRVPADDVRSRVVGLRVLAGCHEACGDPPAARYAARQALALATSTEQVSEVTASLRLVERLR